MGKPAGGAAKSGQREGGRRKDGGCAHGAVGLDLPSEVRVENTKAKSTKAWSFEVGLYRLRPVRAVTVSAVARRAPMLLRSVLAARRWRCDAIFCIGHRRLVSLTLS